MAAIDHDARLYSCFFHPVSSRSYGFGVEVCGLPSATQNQMTVRIAGSQEDRGLSRLRRSQESMRMIRGKDRVNRNLYISGSAILEANRARESGGKLAMDLTLRGSCADGSPTHQIRHILWRNHIEELRARRYSHLCQI